MTNQQRSSGKSSSSSRPRGGGRGPGRHGGRIEVPKIFVAQPALIEYFGDFKAALIIVVVIVVAYTLIGYWDPI